MVVDSERISLRIQAERLRALGLDVTYEDCKMRVTLGLTGLYERFEGRIFSGDEVARGKPAPDLFLHAAERIGCRAERCLVVEDSPAGIAAAAAAGMRSIGYAATTPPDRLASADALLDDMRHLPGLIAEVA